jgi:hypothetical protein
MKLPESNVFSKVDAYFVDYPNFSTTAKVKNGKDEHYLRNPEPVRWWVERGIEPGATIEIYTDGYNEFSLLFTFLGKEGWECESRGRGF